MLAWRNGDWYQMLYVCGVAGILIAEEEGLFVSAAYSDRLLSALKGTMSEAEWHLIEQRMVAGMRVKAGAANYATTTSGVRAGSGRKDCQAPDQPVGAAIDEVFRGLRSVARSVTPSDRRSVGPVAPRPDHPGAVPLQPLPAPLRDPQRQRALIEQAAGLSTRQVAGLIAAAAPELPLRRDTLRALGAGTFSLTITIDQECQRRLHLLKGLLAHCHPRHGAHLLRHSAATATRRHST